MGAVFEIDAQPAITSLEAIGQAFAGLETMLQESVAATASAVNQMVTEVGRLADAWRAVGMEARAGVPGAGGGGGRGGGTGEQRTQREAERAMAEDRRNAEAINRNEDQIYRRQEALAQRENADRNRSYDNMRRMAEAENREFDRIGGADDGISIPRPPRTGVTDFTRAREPLPPRDELSGLPEFAEGAAAGRGLSRRGGATHAGGILRGMGPLIAGLGTYEAEKSAMEEDRSLTQAMQEMGFSPSEPGYMAQRERLRSALQGGTSGTIYSESHGANVLPGNAGQFGAVFATPQERLENYSAILPSAMRFAEVAEQYHRGSLQESLKAAISYSHMTRRYTSDDLGGGLDHLLALSLATGETVAGEQGILKYSVPLGMASGMGPDETAAMTGFFQILGFQGTTAATGLGQMLMGLTQTGGPLAAQNHHRANELGKAFERTLGLNPERLHEVHASRGNQHVEAMQAMGLFDAQGHVAQDVAPGGKLNRDSFLRHIEGYLSTHDPMTDLSTLRNAFTVRGSREAAMLQDPGVIDRLNVFLHNMENPQSAAQLQSELQNQPLPQFMQMLANVANIGNTLATTTLGGLNTAFMTVNENLVAFNNWLKEHQTVATVGGYGLLGGGLLATFGVLGLALRGLGAGLAVLVPGFTGLAGATATATGAASAAGIALGQMVLPITAFLGALAAAGFIGGKWLGNNLPDSVTGKNEAILDLEYRRTHGGMPRWGAPRAGFGADAEHHLGLSAPPVRGYGGSASDPERHVAVAAPKPSLSMTIHNSFSGIITDDTMRTLVDKMTSALRGFLEHAGEMAQGAHQSQYDYSGGH